MNGKDGKTIIIDAVITGKLSDDGQKITGKLTDDGQKITGSVTTQLVPETYEGTYDVMPKIEPQQLATAGKNMKDNVTVWGIPNIEVSNPTGTTFIVGE